jgi:peptidoglycan/LPS O-acetylase OafA/YrhL
LLIDFSINGVMWTLKLEVIAIPLFIIGFLLFRYRGISALAALLATLLILATVKLWTDLVDTPFGLQLLPFFAVGMIVYAIGRKGSVRYSPPIAMLLVIVGMAGMLSSDSLPRFGVRAHRIEMVCGGFIVGLLAFGNLGMLGKIFDHAIIRFYGRISYSFYLVNPLTLLGLLAHTGCARESDANAYSRCYRGTHVVCDIGRSYDTHRLADAQICRTSGHGDRTVSCHTHVWQTIANCHGIALISNHPV